MACNALQAVAPVITVNLKPDVSAMEKKSVRPNAPLMTAACPQGVEVETERCWPSMKQVMVTLLLVD